MKLFKLLAAAIIVMPFTLSAVAQSDDSILADEYIVTQDFIEATVVKVSPLSRTVTVRGEKRGKTRQFVVPEGVKISVNGRTARLRDIRRGDSIMLAMKPKAQQVVVAALQVPRASTTLEQRRANPIVPVESTPVMLPKTASNKSVLLLLGLLALFAAAGLRAARR